MQQKLIVFDVDGVLLDNQMGGLKDILVILGFNKEITELDRLYQQRKHKGPWGLNEVIDLYRGQSQQKLDELALFYCQKHLMANADLTIQQLKELHHIVGAISTNPEFILKRLQKLLNLDFISGTKLEFRNGLATGRIAFKVDRYVKAELIEQTMNKYQKRPADTYVVGDSITDIPMAKQAGCFIAFNASSKANQRADYILDKHDLSKIVDLLSN